ncbi:hypothetical protein [Sphingomonas sp. 22176]|uniref:hypothetical protein n=1 Tax=Sphingomonas sp. 22176 TaxID=3453884 RepID=UPI003F824358
MSVLVAALSLGVPAAAKLRPGKVPLGTFRPWKPSDGRVAWRSGGIRIQIEPAPCATPPQTEGCRFDPQNNQPLVTVHAPGLPIYRVLGDRQSSRYRVAVVRFERGDARPGVVIENQSGGSSGDVREQLLFPRGRRFRQTWLPGYLQGALPDRLKDLSGDGRIDFVLGDGAFAYAFGCNACTPRPAIVLTVRHGRPIDASRLPDYAAAFRPDLPVFRKRCFDRAQRYRNGSCAAYVATAARMGLYAAAWRQMLRHYNREGIDIWQDCTVPPAQWNGGGCPSGKQTHYATFPQSLAAFLRKTGYSR